MTMNDDCLEIIQSYSSNLELRKVSKQFNSVYELSLPIKQVLSKSDLRYLCKYATPDTIQAVINNERHSSSLIDEATKLECLNILNVPFLTEKTSELLFIKCVLKNVFVIVKRLLSKITISHDSFVLACENGHMEVVRLLLQDERVDPSFDNNIAFTTACSYGNLDIVRLLLQHVRLDPSDSNRALVLASAYGHVEVVRLLLQHERVDSSFNR